MSNLATKLREQWGLIPTEAPKPKVQLETVGEKKRVKLPVVQGRAPEFSLQSMVDMFLANLSDAESVTTTTRYGGERSDGVFHASEISDELTCKRRLAYCIYQAPRNEREVDAKLRRIFDQGHYQHTRLQHYIVRAIEANRGKAWTEMGYEPDAKRRSGTSDIGFVLRGWPYLVEIKGINKAGFEALTSDPLPHHKGQLNQYMGLTQVHAGFLLYECKDNQELREYFLRFDRKEWNRVDGVADEVLAHVAAGTLPDKITEEDGCDGKQCPYHRICKAKQGRIKWDPPKR